MEELKYIIEDSTIAQLLGVQNFSTDEAAILELVKNAYDAKALTLEVIFEKNSLSIIDDGIGMSESDIKTHWMHIGKSSKEYEIKDSNNNIRIQAGSKGVGRFALSRLGNEVIVFSKKEGCEGIKWTTDWNKSVLDKCDTEFSKGTYIFINGLREKWSKRRVIGLLKYLERTYNDTAMKIFINTKGYREEVKRHFPDPKIGINCRSNIILDFDGKGLTVTIKTNEFTEEAKKWCPDIDLEYYEKHIDMLSELEGNSNLEDVDEEVIQDKLGQIGKFNASLFFNLSVNNIDKEKFCYKFSSASESVDNGVILYRNAFSISSFEGHKDWLGLGKRSRKSPAAASHPTGAWRVRENQLSGWIKIDKKENKFLQDLANRQGLDENIHYRLFIEIILTGIKEFERYRQSIIRKIDKKNDTIAEEPKPIVEKLMKNPLSVKRLSDHEAKQLKTEIALFRTEGKKYKEDKKIVEERYKYDVRILNVLSTVGLKASSIAHEMKNDRNDLDEIYGHIVDSLKEYDMWEELCAPENQTKIFRNVPYLLEQNNKVSKKLVVFMDTMLSEIEKKQFEPKSQNVYDVLERITSTWMRDYSWIDIKLIIETSTEYLISEDILQVIFDNLILNSVQQNDSRSKLDIEINVKISTGLLMFDYRDYGKGLDKKYKDDPMKILEVHESTRKNGHGLGMWIINNTITVSGGEIYEIEGDGGFRMSFSIGGNYNG